MSWPGIRCAFEITASINPLESWPKITERFQQLGNGRVFLLQSQRGAGCAHLRSWRGMRSARHMRIPREGCRPVGRWIVHLADLAVHQLAMSRPLLLDMFRAAVDDWLCLAGSPHDLGCPAAINRRKDDLGAPNRASAECCDRRPSSRRRSASMTFTTIPALITRA